MVEIEEEIVACGAIDNIEQRLLKRIKQNGYSDRQIATLLNTSEIAVRQWRKEQGVIPVFKSVDTCAAEFETYTPYYYSTYEEENEAPEKPEGKK